MEINYGENLARTFNTAKRYAEEILFPKMDMFQKYQRQSEFGDENLEDSLLLSPEVRDIQRFNGLKGMINILHGLLMNIESTIRINKKKNEIKLLEEMQIKTRRLNDIFTDEKEKFFENEWNGSDNYEKLNKTYFNKVKSIVERMYVNTEILMTKNKLLFAESRDDYLEDKEIIERVKNEYIDE